ncbi:alpha-galactosidase [Mucilaginibacter sp. SG564]|uniref:alpha-galactosidase n=1 Tax=Mucilaginibacter sp. SG564 TaxID=2587022 RepID=UPI001556A503|nr:alpha-galactosidase [Mucilaginibacter sp. SG564]NOW95051.1 alpha-galactosidase [Mucilaginibacter sp. SG564]
MTIKLMAPCLGALLMTFAGLFAAGDAHGQDKDILKIPYGKDSYIEFKGRESKFNVYSRGKLLYSNADCSYTVNSAESAETITAYKHEQSRIRDGFGPGTKTVITLNSGNIKAEEIFYTYPGREFFLTQVRLTGKGLSSNRIIPFTASLAPLPGNWHSLFVPFDNDTFISYDSKAMLPPFKSNSAEVAVVFDDVSRHGFIAGSVEHGIWKTGMQTELKPGQVAQITALAGFTDADITRDRMDHGSVKGDTICSPRIFCGFFEDWRKGMEEFGKANRIAEPPFVYNWTKPTPVGWNSWGVMQDKLTFDKALKVIHFFADSLKGFRTGGTAFIDLDSFWDRMMTGHADFSRLKAFADSCLSKGLQPGVYWAPFTDWGWKSGPDRKVEGSDYNYGDLWTKTTGGYHEIDGARAIDPTHPGTRKRIDYFIDKLKECGFKMIKIDFLGHGSAESTHFYDTTVTTGMQAYRKGMEYLINRIGDQMFIYAAISPSLATGRYVHARRIACDAFKTIDHTRYTLNSVTYGWWQTFLYNFVDADHVVLASESEGANRARFLSAVITGTCITGDDFSVHGQWSDRAVKLYQNPAILSVIKNGKAFMPVATVPGKEAATLFTRKIGDIQYLAVFNYGTSPKRYLISPSRLGINAKRVKVNDLMSQEISTEKNIIVVDLPGADATILKITPEGK